MKKIKFGKMEPISNLPGDDAVAPIYCEGTEVGEIRRCMVDVGASIRVIRVGLYCVAFWDEALGSHDECFVANGDARAALMAARNHARKVLR